MALSLPVCLAAGGAHAGHDPVRPPAVAFLVAEPPGKDLGRETWAAYETLRGFRIAQDALGGVREDLKTTLVRIGPKGALQDDKGKSVTLSDFDAVWYHQGDAIARTAWYRGAPLAAVRQFAKSGKGVLLSGGALAMVQQLGLESAIRPQRRERRPEDGGGALVACVSGHPALRNLHWKDDGVAWISRRPPKAIADFVWGGPTNGMVLARDPANDLACPLVEYQLGKGRVIVLGYLVPCYDDPGNPHLRNLHHLTQGLLTYLARPIHWKPVRIHTDFPPRATADGKITPERWESLRLAVEDLVRTFGPRYPKGREYLVKLGALRAEYKRVAAARGATPQAAQEQTAAELAERFEALHDEALRANPLLDFDELLFIRRKANRLGLAANYNGNADLPTTGYDNRICTLRMSDPAGKTATLYQPEGGRFVGDLDLHTSGRRMLMTMPDEAKRWRVWELNLPPAARKGRQAQFRPGLPLRAGPKGRQIVAGPVRVRDGGTLNKSPDRATEDRPICRPFGTQALGTPQPEAYASGHDLPARRASGRASRADNPIKYPTGLSPSPLQPRKLTLIPEPDVANTDACYLPDGGVMFTSTATYTGVPCVGGASHVANLYVREPAGRVRRLTFDQDHNWCPAVLSSGKVLYQRWEYADIAHAYYRLLFHMNPDGTEQMEYYGSNSFWPTTMFYARPVPGHATKVAAIVGGHHGFPRMGELVLLDPARGRFEADGVVQRIPGRGKPVKPYLQDGLAARSWPRFLHPWPLSEKYLLVSCQPAPGRPWGLYLVDTFDNFVLLREEPGYALLEPIPLAPAPAPPPITPNRTDLTRKDALVLLLDVYRGRGLRGVRRGTIKALRIISYEFAFRHMGGEPDRVGLDGPWDVRRIVGTVPVEPDGSAFFRVPANTPLALQPLDEEGKAVQLMRSWLSAMPGEVLSCVGCHERQNTAAPAVRVQATARAPREITPWYGPARGFSFAREGQPVLDKYCIRCHNPTTAGEPLNWQRIRRPDLTARPPMQTPQMGYNARFPPAYLELRRFVRNATQESDAHLLMPREFHADTTKLVQMLRAGHHGVRLDAEAWDRLVTWIDLNAPAHGTWGEVVGHIKGKHVAQGNRRRRELMKRYAFLDIDEEALPPPPPLEPSKPNNAPKAPIRNPQSTIPKGPSVRHPPGWPFDATEAARRQRAGGRPVTLRLTLAKGVTIELVRIPAGEFLMGDAADGGNAPGAPGGPGAPAKPRTGAPGPSAGADTPAKKPRRVRIDKPFYLGRTEVTNAQYACFDADHDSGLEVGDFEQFGPYQRGYGVNRPRQPVVRVSHEQATAFCRWLSKRTGRRVSLPTETQWEYACRAGTATPLWYGGLDTDFSAFANVSDATHRAVDYPHVPHAIAPWKPADDRFRDGWRVSAPVATFRPNPWGLYDTHGNAAEWTSTSLAPPTTPPAEKAPTPTGRARTVPRMIVRGGSWYDRPVRCRSSFRRWYPADQRAFDVGFRIVVAP